MKGNVILFFLLFCSVVGFGQVQNPDKLRHIEQDELTGTFQIVLLDERMIEPEITDQLLLMVENQRLQSSDIYVDLDAYTRLYLPSYDQISEESFIKLNLYRYE